MDHLLLTARGGARQPPRGVPGLHRCDCYGCQLARKQGDAHDAPYPVATPMLGVASLQRMLFEVVPGAPDVEVRVDDILGRALDAFDAHVISESEFATLTTQCLDKLSGLAR